MIRRTYESEVNDNVVKHAEICKKINELFAKKNAAYGNSFSDIFKKRGFEYPIIRLEEKISRLDSLANGNAEGDSIEDTLLDIANYAILTLLELKK